MDAVKSVEGMAIEQRMYNLMVEVARTFFVDHGAKISSELSALS